MAETVAAPIEQQVNGVEDMLYMASQSTNDGSYTLTVTFKPGINLNLAQVLVQNRVALAMPLLPEVVRQTGVITRKRSPDILMTVSLNSPDRRYDQLYLSNYALMRVRDELSRLPGISEVLVFGQRDYSMRIWLDPDKLASRDLEVTDVVNAIREQNMHVALGQIGQPPAVDGQMKQMPLSVRGRLTMPEEFENIVIKFTRDRRSVAAFATWGAFELGARSEDISNRFDGKPTVGLAVFQLPDANALDTADRVKEKMAELYGTIFPTASSTRSATTRPPTFANRSARSSRPCATRCFWWRSWCWSSCRDGAPRSFRWSPCRWRSSAHSRPWPWSDSA